MAFSCEGFIVIDEDRKRTMDPLAGWSRPFSLVSLSSTPNAMRLDFTLHRLPPPRSLFRLDDSSKNL